MATVVTEPVIENHSSEIESLCTPEPHYEPISDDEEFIRDFIDNFSNNLPRELGELIGTDISEYLQCNVLYSDDSFVESNTEGFYKRAELKDCRIKEFGLIKSDNDSEVTTKMLSKKVEELNTGETTSESIPNRDSSELEDSKLNCVTYTEKDFFCPDSSYVTSENDMIKRARNLGQKANERWNWLKTPYLRNAGYGDNEGDAEINEIMEDTTYKFDSLLILAEEETKDILNAFYYFDHLCRDCNICHTNNGRLLGDCNRAKNLQYRRDKPYREWCGMNYLMHEFIKNSSIPLHIVEQYRKRGPIRDSPLYKLKWTENGEYLSKGSLWVDKTTRLPLQVHVLGGCMDINPVLSIEQWHRLAGMLNEFDEILAFNPKKIGTCSIIQHKIDTGDSPPIHQNPYIYAAPLREEINRQVNELIELGIVVPSRSPWSSPVVLVDKKDGTKRMCIDLRKVNSVTKSDVYPLPSISIALSSMQGAQYFSSFDLNCGYYQIELEESSREKTAFITQDGLFEYKKMMFGLKTAPSCFARTMDIVLAGLKWSSVLVYIDDILIFSKDFDSHVEHIREVFQRLKAANLTVKPNKCSLAMDSIKFLGHVIDRTGVRTDPDKIKGIQEFPRPQTLTQVRGFIGRASYYRKFIPYFSEIAEPLSRLTKKNVRFNWGSEQERAFNHLKQLLSSQPVLTHFDGSKALEVRCDASVIGIGAELVQLEELGWKLVANASRLLTDAERAYGTSERECLAIVYATEKFAPYIHGLKFTVVTDHLALK